MSLGRNIQFLRKIYNGMTQEQLAEKMGVSRQTISKWELDIVYPEINKVIDLCELFSCSMDQLIREDIDINNKAFSDIKVKKIAGFSYVKYAVISEEPEEDAKNHIKDWAYKNGIKEPEIIGWDFTSVSQEQINVYHMHGYAAACILPNDYQIMDNNFEVIKQKEQKYAVISIKDPFRAPYMLIPNAYKTLMRYIEVNRLKYMKEKGVLPCYEKEYMINGVNYIDIHIAIEN